MAKAKRTRQRKDAIPMDTPTEAQLNNHAYQRRFVTHAETNTKAIAFVSSHDPVERWLQAGRLSCTQEVAIDAVRRLWGILGHGPKVTATYGERTPRGNVEYRAINEIEAREDITRIEGYFPGLLRTYWHVFENVCRWGMPAGVAGGDLGYGTRSGDVRAHQIVCFVADFIAAKERY